MGTKNLARSAIEGGRTGRNKWERRHSHDTERASERDYCNKVKTDPEAYDDFDTVEKVHVYKEFADKLGPMYRWLERQVGRVWDEVRSEVSQTFDTRTTAGRHIVYDHLLSSVEVTPDVHRRYYRDTDDPNTSYYKHDFYVNEDGVLCKRKYIPGYGRAKHPSFNTAPTINWLNGRVVGKVGEKLYWFVPVDKNKKRGGVKHIWRTTWGHSSFRRPYGLIFSYLSKTPIYKRDSVGKLILQDGNTICIGFQDTWHESSPIFRQDRKLNDKEKIYWDTIPEYYQGKILERSPTSPKPVQTDPYYYYY